MISGVDMAASRPKWKGDNIALQTKYSNLSFAHKR